VVRDPSKARLGREEPRIWTPPLRPLTPSTSLGFAAIEFATEVLGIELYPWQRWLLIHALELLEDGSFRFRKIVVLVARQNGKSTLSQVLSLFCLYVLGIGLVLGTAQDLDTAEEVWDGALELIEGNEELSALAAPPIKVNGKKTIRLKTGERYKVKAAGRRSGRGLSGDLILLDELREHQTWEAWGAITKDLANSTPILRADGTWTTIGEVRVGDRVFAPSGAPVPVTAVHPITRLRPMYRVITTDGRSVLASASHLWTVKDTRRSYDLASGWETLTTRQILDRGLRRKGTEWVFRLPRQHALADLPARDLPIDPYVLGCWLGDGTTDDGTVTVGAVDLDVTCDLLTRAGATVTSRIETRPGTWRVRLHAGGRPLRVVLRETGLLGHKHVPEEYLSASVDQRLSLLRGLLDTDGCVTGAGLAKFTTTRECLADAVLFLARSLGWSARKSQFVPRFDGRACGVGWNVTFTVREGEPVPFGLPRKAAGCAEAASAGQWLHASIASIEPVESEPSTCIAVDSDDHLFLAGRDLIPTHNTTMARPNAQIWALSNAGDASSIVLRYLRKMAHLALGDPDDINANDDPSRLLDDDAGDNAEVDLDDDSLGIFEWSAPPGCSVKDRDGWAMANPSLGYAIPEKTLASDAHSDPEWTFRTECLCQWSDGTLEGPFPAGAWDAGVDGPCKRPKDCDRCDQHEPGYGGSVIAVDSPVGIGLSVAWDRSRASIGAAGLRPDELPHVEVIATRAGTDWVVDWFTDPKHPHRKDYRVAIQPSSPAGSLIDDLEEAGITVVGWKGPDLPQSHGRFYDAVKEHRLRHRPQAILDVAAATAVPKTLGGDAWVWDLRKSPVDISGLVACTGALWLSSIPVEEADPFFAFG